MGSAAPCGQRLLLSALRRLRWVLPCLLSRTDTPTGWRAWDNPYTGGYGRGYARPMDHTAASAWARCINPMDRWAYSRGAAGGRRDRLQCRAAGQAYNPRTGTYGQTRQGSNVYGNWGTSAVHNAVTVGRRRHTPRTTGAAHRHPVSVPTAAPARSRASDPEASAPPLAVHKAATSTPAATATSTAANEGGGMATKQWHRRMEHVHTGRTDGATG